MEKKAILKQYAFRNMYDINKIVFLGECNEIPSYVQDFSQDNDGSVVGWKNDSNVLYIASTCSDKIFANEDSSFMFFNCRNLTSIQGLQYLDTSNVKDMSYMFSNCVSLTNLDLSSFNTHLVKTMAYMFDGCESLKEVNLEGVNTLRVTNMTHMFANCKNLEMVECEFDMRSVKDSDNMFANCPKFFV